MEDKKILTIEESRSFIEKLNNICMDCSKICDSIFNLLVNTSKCRNVSISYEEELLGNFLEIKFSNISYTTIVVEIIYKGFTMRFNINHKDKYLEVMFNKKISDFVSKIGR